MMHSDDKLIRMAGQMADFFRSQPGAPAEAVAGHINSFWTPRMRQDFVRHLAEGAEADPIVRDAARFVRLPEQTPARA
ncbi:formate dehydrogenase subunit delta [Paracoccus litorisediminis]|jgi:formate dehydrogenase subunit delta|uniref:Formate dehydrogenase n=1 Tax=Paracoccus litorisediminis TaxID=2006130 RepID=A0A844HHT0_9RHOB|nr:formate dehydrogenase subunit delta [Paracoccus litorisediminis]MTH57994.1 formate dehydrogenase [Paracoccus litorisediminis]